MEFDEIVEDLGILTESVQSDIGSEYSKINNRIKKITKSANKAMKSGKYAEASNYCSQGIQIINDFKNKVSSSGLSESEKIPMPIGKTIRNIAVCVLGMIAVAAVVFAGGKHLQKKADAKHAESERDRKAALKAQSDENEKRRSSNEQEASAAVNKASADADAAHDRMSKSRDALKDAVDGRAGERSSSLRWEQGLKGTTNTNMRQHTKKFQKEIDQLQKEYDSIKKDSRYNIDSRKREMQRIKKQIAKLEDQISDYNEHIGEYTKDKKNEYAARRDADKKEAAIPGLIKHHQDSTRSVVNAKKRLDSARSNYNDTVAKNKAERSAEQKAIDTNIERSSITADKVANNPKIVGAIGLGAGVVTGLASVIKGKTTVASMIKSLDLAKSSLEAIKKKCDGAARGNESYLDDDEYDVMDWVLEGAFENILCFYSDSYLASAIECGLTDDEACELFIECSED